MRGKCHLKWPPDLRAGEIVEHKSRPGVPLVVVSGPVETPWGDRYIVRLPNGTEVRVEKRNLVF